MKNMSGQSTWVLAYRRLRQNRLASMSMLILLCIFVLMFLGPLISPYDAESIDYEAFSIAPSLSTQHYFGTDSVGRDLFTRTMEGTKVSVLIGLVATLVSLVIGVHYGAIAGYYGGRVDAVMMRIVYMTLIIPQVILVESFLSFLGLGIQEPMTSLGALVSEGAEEMVSSQWMLLFPGIFLTLLLLSFNFLGDGLRDAFDPKQEMKLDKK